MNNFLADFFCFAPLSCKNKVKNSTLKTAAKSINHSLARKIANLSGYTLTC